MFSIPSFYELGGGPCSDSYEIFHGLLNTSPVMSPDIHESPNLSPTSMAEAKAAAASNSHKEAERRRRKRINTHIATLKSILPNTIKKDKASLLGEAVRRVRELKKTASELESDDVSDPTLKLTVPTESDELKVCRDETGLLKATICCDDRSEMVLDVIQAMKSVEGKVVRAEMSTVGGRTKMVVWVRLLALGSICYSSCNSSTGFVGGESDAGLGKLRRALKTVMDKSTLLAGSGQALPGIKRPRYYHF